MRKVTRYEWEGLFKQTQRGMDAINKFRRLTSDECTSADMLEVAKEYDPDIFENVGVGDREYLELIDRIRDALDWLLYDELPYIDDRECLHEVYSHLLVALAGKYPDYAEAEDILDSMGNTDFKGLEGWNTLVSLALHSALPEVFLPNLFVMRADVLREVADGWDIQMPPLPPRTSHRKRCLYYALLNDALYGYARGCGIDDPAEACALLYAYLSPRAEEAVREKNSAPMPEKPLRAWMLCGNYGGDEREMESGYWQCNGLARRGDILVFYEKSPTKKINAIYRAQTDGITDPFFHYYSYVRIGGRIEIPDGQAATYAQMRESRYFSEERPKEGNFVAKNFQDVSGWRVTYGDYREIVSILASNGFDVSMLPTMFKPGRYAETEVRNERDVSRRLVMLLNDMGWVEGRDFEREVKFPAGHTETGASSDKRPDFCLHVKRWKDGEITAKVVIEVKRLSGTERQLLKDMNQARTYAKWGSPKVLALCDKECIRVFTRKSDSERFDMRCPTEFWWAEMDTDRVAELKSLFS